MHYASLNHFSRTFCRLYSFLHDGFLFSFIIFVLFHRWIIVVVSMYTVLSSYMYTWTWSHSLSFKRNVLLIYSFVLFFHSCLPPHTQICDAQCFSLFFHSIYLNLAEDDRNMKKGLKKERRQIWNLIFSFWEEFKVSHGFAVLFKFGKIIYLKILGLYIWQNLFGFIQFWHMSIL